MPTRRFGPAGVASRVEMLKMMKTLENIEYELFMARMARDKTPPPKPQTVDYRIFIKGKKK
jgi:hypothetical protein